MFEISQLFGLPAHPLLVHIPVVLIPFATLTALAALWRRYRTLFAIATASMAVIGGFGALLAAEAGESLNEILRKRSPTLRNHMEIGDTAKGASVLFAMFAVILVIIVLLRAWNHQRVRAIAERVKLPRWTLPAALALTAISGIAATYTIIDAGHSGAKSVWEKTASSMIID